MANVTRTLAILLFVLAVALGAFAFMLARPSASAPAAHRETNVDAQAVADRHLVPVVVAARDLPAGQSLDAAALAVRMQSEAAPGAFNDVGALTGRVTRAAVPQGAPLTVDALSSGLADVVAPGERAVAVQIDETNAVGSYLRPGNFVDVFFTLKREGGGNSEAEVQATQTRLLLSKVRVLSVGAASMAGPDAGASRDPNAAAARLPSRTAVLAVRTADVDVVTLAESAGHLTLALRNAADEEVQPPQTFASLVQVSASQNGPGQNGAARAAAGVSLSALASARVVREQKAAAAAAPVTPRADGIEVIRGGRVERTAY
jgi:pilus assembly protein CpaB